MVHPRRRVAGPSSRAGAASPDFEDGADAHLGAQLGRSQHAAKKGRPSASWRSGSSHGCSERLRLAAPASRPRRRAGLPLTQGAPMKASLALLALLVCLAAVSYPATLTLH